MPVKYDKKVLVMILKNSKYESRSGSIRRAFQNNMFEIHHINNHNKKKRNYDIYLEALKKACEISKSSHVILISDCMITVAPSSTVTSAVRRLLNEPDDFIYLHRYNDKCQIMSPLSSKCDCGWNNSSSSESSSDHDHDSNRSSNSESEHNFGSKKDHDCSCGFDVVRTRSPNGDDCIMFSPHGRDILLGRQHMNNNRKLNIKHNISDSLNRAVEKGYVSAIAATPNLFEYDIIYNATNNAHYERRCECAPLQLLADPVETTSGVSNLLLLIFVFFIILVVAWALINIGPK